MTKLINKPLIEQAETIAKKMSKLKMGSYEDLRKKILRDLGESKLKALNKKFEEELDQLLAK